MVCKYNYYTLLVTVKKYILIMATTIGQDSITILEKKIKKHTTQLDDLTEEFAANDDGEIELRDIHPLIMDALKIM